MYVTTADYRMLKVATSGIISMFAGTGTQGNSGNDGKATSAKITDPRNCVLDSNGNVYMSDMSIYAVRVVTVSTKKIITKYAGAGTSVSGSNRPGDGGPATSAKMYPQSIFMDSTGNLFVAENTGFRVRKVDPGTKIITAFAGTGSNTLAGMDGRATSAGIPGASAFIAGDNSGNLVIGSDSKRLFRVNGATNLISNFAG
jgi:hypothetical protein